MQPPSRVLWVRFIREFVGIVKRRLRQIYARVALWMCISSLYKYKTHCEVQYFSASVSICAVCPNRTDAAAVSAIVKAMALIFIMFGIRGYIFKSSFKIFSKKRAIFFIKRKIAQYALRLWCIRLQSHSKQISVPPKLILSQSVAKVLQKSIAEK